MKISAMMDTRVETVSPDTDFQTLLTRQQNKASQLLYVLDQGRLAGVISSLDLLKVMAPVWLDENLSRAVSDDQPLTLRSLQENAGRTARELMTANPVTLTPQDHVLRAETLLRDTGFNVLPVVDDNGALLGEIGRGAILRYLAAQAGK
jgi:CBS-domain-containing membrane protein